MKPVMRYLFLAVMLVMCMASVSFSGVIVPVRSDIDAEAYGIQDVVNKFPGLYNVAENRTQSFFSTSGAANIIQEYVFVEVPVDLDLDGERDLIRITICRPAVSGNPATDPTKIRVPVWLSASPYNGTGNNNSCENYHFNEWVEGEQLTVSEQKALTGRGDTTHYQYETHVKSKKPRAHEWHWGDTPWQYTDDCGCVMTVPASRGAKPVTAAKTGGGQAANASHAPRGFASITSASYVGSTGSSLAAGDTGMNQGIARGGDVEETIVVAAVIQWLTGDCRGYTDWTCTNEVIADWCNGNVAMSGTSYPGTFAAAAAISGVKGIKAVIPQAPPVSYYQYYRSNGGTFQAIQEQGSDNSWCSAYIIPPSGTDRMDLPTSAKGWRLLKIFNEYMAHYAKGEDRHSGDYNQFWDTRNFMVDVPATKAGILLQQGFLDYNVEIVQSDMFYRAFKKHNPNYPIKMMMHQNAHTGFAGAVSIPTPGGPASTLTATQFIERWLDYFCWGIDNGILNTPNVWIADNITGNVDAYADWPIPSVTDSKYFLSSTADDAGGLLTLAVPTAVTMNPVKDVYREEVLTRLGYEEPGSGTAPAETPGGNHRTRRKGRDQIRGDLWQDWMIRYPGYGAHSDGRLAFITAPFTEETLLSGTPVVTLELAADMGKGTVSVAIVDVGQVARSINYPNYNSGTHHTTSGNRYVPQPNNASWVTNHYFVLSRGSVDLQNPNPSGLTYVSPEIGVDTGLTPPYYYQTKDIQPGEVNTYTFTMHPAHYRFRIGTQLAVYVYTADYRYSTIPDIDRVAVSLKLGAGTYINLPLDKPLPVAAPPAPGTPLPPDIAIARADAFKASHAVILAKTAATVTKTAGTGALPSSANADRALAVTAWSAYIAQPDEVKALLAPEKAKLYELFNAIAETEYARRANYFKSTISAMNTTDMSAVWTAWSNYKGLNIGVKKYLEAEKNMLISSLMQLDLILGQIVSVTYHLNGGTGIVPIEGQKANGSTFVAPDATEITSPVRTYFLGWNTAADGSGKAYAPGETILVQGYHDLNLYAKYSEPPEPISVTPYASVEKLTGNKNNLTITIFVDYADYDMEIIEKTFSIDNNAANTYVVGPYKVYVDTKGNTQIRACYIVK